MTAKDQTISRDELMARFREIASEVAERDIPLASEDTAISALGIDSLGMLEIVGEMERRLKIRLPDEALAGVETVQNLLDVVEKRQQMAN